MADELLLAIHVHRGKISPDFVDKVLIPDLQGIKRAHDDVQRRMAKLQDDNTNLKAQVNTHVLHKHTTAQNTTYIPYLV